jgi:hypothetical protein
MNHRVEDGPEVDIIAFFTIHDEGTSTCGCTLCQNYVKMLAGLR